MDGSAGEKIDTDVDTESEEKVKVEFERDGNNDGTFYGGEHQDVANRHRYFHTACVAFSMFALVTMFLLLVFIFMPVLIES